MSFIDDIPSFYDNKYIRAIQESLEKECLRFEQAYDDTLKQFFVESATWGLDLWEGLFRIKKKI